MSKIIRFELFALEVLSMPAEKCLEALSGLILPPKRVHQNKLSLKSGFCLFEMGVALPFFLSNDFQALVLCGVDGIVMVDPGSFEQ